MGFRPREVAIVLYGAGGLAAAFSLLQSVAHSRFSGLLIVLFCAITWIGVQRLRYVELDVLRSMVVGGEFRRLLTWRIRLQLFQDSLEQSSTFDECWLLIRDTCRELGFFEVSLRIGDAHYSERFRHWSSEDTWDARVDLSPAAYVDIRAPLRSQQSGAIAPLLEVVMTRMRAKLSRTMATGPVPAVPAALHAHVAE
jgi:hypothetical protein